MRTPPKKITIKKAIASDVEEIKKAATEFFHESAFRDLTLDIEYYGQVLSLAFDSDNASIFLAFVDNKLAGYVGVMKIREFTVEPYGEVYQFYVRKPFRGTCVARSLVFAADKQFAEWGCRRMFAESGSGISTMNNSMFSNLWKKFGYINYGTLMGKEIG